MTRSCRLASIAVLALGVAPLASRAIAQQPVAARVAPASPAAEVRALADAGRYDEAEPAARRLAAGAGGTAALNTLGEVLVARGRLASAESAFVRSIAAGATDSLTAAVNLAVLHYDRGERERAAREFDRFIDIYNVRGAALTSRELAAVALACRYLGVSNAALFKDALKAYDRSIAADPANADARAALGELFLSKYNGTDAQASFAAALEVRPLFPRALVGAAERMIADGEPGADSLLTRALELNPSYVRALVLRAREAMDIEQFAEAERAINRALAVNPSSADAIAMAAAIKYVSGDLASFESFKARALALNPRNGEFFATMAEAAGRVRRYEAAATFARQGVDADPRQWKARGLLGMNLLRLGRIADGRTALDSSFAGDPYDVWVKNTLDLLDTFVNYDTSSTVHTTLMIEKGESALLSIYLGELAEQAYQAFAARYQYTPPLPVRIEVYRSHADFSVRTVGLAGLGALGVSFGSTLAFDSPAAKDAGPFNWGSTVWHELAHTFTLGMTDHRVPRWLSEGLSVWEEHRARQGWGFAVSKGFLAALREGKLVPVSRMNDGFMHPAYPEQVQFSYYQASLICDLIAADKGEQALVAMLREYKAGRTTAEVFARVLGTDLQAFDRKFDGYMKERFRDARPVATSELVESAKVLADSGRGEQASGLLWAAVYQDETSLPAHLALAALLERQGDTRKTAEMLERSLYIDPFEMAVHMKLASLFSALGERAKAIRERRAVVAMGPVDRAEAWFALATAQMEAGDAAGAKVSVIRALEEAPNFAKAQELLLTLVDGRQP